MLGRSPKNSPWQLKQVEAVRQAVFRHLDIAFEDAGIEARLTAALAAVADSGRAFTPEAQLERLIYVIAALAHHGRWGGLSDRDAKQLAQIAEAILLTHGVDKTSSTLSVLWGELHFARSQALRLAGRTWESFWEQHLAHQASRRAPVGTSAFHSLASGLRALRLGMLDIATSALARAAEADLPERNREQAMLGHVQAVRLAGKHEEARSHLDKLLSSHRLSLLARRDAAWETLVQDAVASGNLNAMTKAVGPHGDHRHGTFALEAFLWTRAAQSRQFEERLPGIRALRGVCGDVLSQAPAFRVCFTACSYIDDAYDPERPLHLRTRALGTCLHDASLLPSLDKELLLRAAACRWLYRAKQLEFAAFVFADYEMRCRQLSAGTNADVLNLLSDINRGELLEHSVAPQLRSAS